jgi:hypothetical protein
MKWGVPQSVLRSWISAQELVAWWWNEMRDIGAQLLRFLPSRKSPQVFIRLSAGGATVECREADDWKVIGTVPAAPDGSLPGELPGLPAQFAAARAAIIVPDEELFFCEFELPAAAERQLASVLRLQLERSLPMSLDQVVFDRQIVAQGGESLTVRVAVAHRDRIESLRDSVAAWNLLPVCAGSVNEQGAVLFNFLKRRRDPLRWHPTRLDILLMRTAAAGAGVLALVLGTMWARERYVVNTQSAELHAQAARLVNERAALLDAAQPLVQLQAIAGTRDAPAVLAALSSSMPRGSWFTHIEIVAHVDAPGRLRLTGPVDSREGAIKALGAVPGVRNIKTSSAFGGEVAGPEVVELSADFDAAQKTAAHL